MCAGTLQLDRVDWIARETAQKSMFYYMQYDKQRHFTSLFGPAPALAGALALLDVGDGGTLTDSSLRSRERFAAAVCLALAAVLLLLACVATASLTRSLVASSTAVLSFAGAASLGQGLWQATPALPFLVGALAAWAWRDRYPRLVWLVPALLVQVVMIRPVVAPLALGIGITWALETRRAWHTWLVAAGIALATAAPWIVWNALHQNSPLSVAQWSGNKRLAEHVFSLSSIPEAIAGLLVSPARGVLWFAPIAIGGIVVGIRAPRTRWLAAGCIVQLLLMAAFFRWHGGQAYGPRLLSELVWVACFLAFAAPKPLHRAVAIPAIAITILVGQLGLWLYTPAQWERRRAPDVHRDALWDVVDSPIRATLSPSPPPAISDDDPPIATWRCEHGRVVTAESR